MGISWTNVLGNFCLTIFCYLFFPTVWCLLGKQYTSKQIKRRIIINGVCIYFIFTFLGGGNATAAFLWSSVAYWMLRKNCLVEESSTSTNGIPAETQDTLPEPADSTEVGCVIQEKPIVKVNRSCRKCGKELTEDSVYCRFCGKKVKQPKPPVPIGKRILVLTVVLLIVVTSAFAGYFLMNYQNGVTAMDNQQFIAAQRYFDKIPYSGQLFPDETAYIRAGVLMEEGKYIEALKAFDNLEDVPTSIVRSLSDNIIAEGYYLEMLQAVDELKNISIPSSTISALTSRIYAAGQKAYKNDKLEEARRCFKEIQDYKQSADYLLLISCKKYPSSFLMNNHEYIVSLIGFEDAAEILLTTQGSSLRFLKGTWKGKNKDSSKYFEIDKYNESSYNLPHNNTDGYYYLSDGIYSVGEVESGTKKLFKFKILDENTISVYCYKDNSTYKLYRQ